MVARRYPGGPVREFFPSEYHSTPTRSDDGQWVRKRFCDIDINRLIEGE